MRPKSMSDTPLYHRLYAALESLHFLERELKALYVACTFQPSVIFGPSLCKACDVCTVELMSNHIASDTIGDRLQ